MQRLFRGSPRATSLLPLLVFLIAISSTLAAFAAPGLRIAGATQGPPGVELDGNALDDPADLENEDDWDTITGWDNGVFTAPGGNWDISTGLLVDGSGVTIFTTGGSKDILDVSDWRWTDGNVPDKDDILNGGAALYPGNILFFFADRYANNGDAALGFWLLQDAVGLQPDGTFTGNHVVGDLFVVADFVNGGAQAVVPTVYRWVGDGSGSDGNLDLLAGITASEAFAVTNDVPEESPWPYIAKFPSAPVPGASYTFPYHSFFEGGIDLDALGIDPCFSSFLIETRSSQETTAQLKDFILGEFSTIPVCSITGPEVICDGAEDLVYSADCDLEDGTLYSWQVLEGGSIVGSASGSSITVDSTPGADSIVVQLDVSRNGCAGGPFFYTTDVNPNPVVSVNNDEVCDGFAGSLTASVVGGTAPFTYSWTGPGGFTASTQTINPTVAGLYTVEVTDALGCMGMNSGTLTVDPNPTVQVNDDEVCAGFSGTLTATPAGGTGPYTYAWTGPGGFNATSQSINPTVAGEYCVVVTDSKGCVSQPGCGDLVVNPNLNIQVNDDEVCAGFAGSMTATPNNGTGPFTYAWTGPGGFNSTAATINPTVAGEYCVTVTDANGCEGSACGDLTVDPNPTVQVNDDEVCAGFSGTLNATPAGGTAPYTYAWTGPGGFNATSQSINPTVAGEYCVVVTDSKGCVSEPGCGDLVVNPNPTVQVNDDEVCAGFSGTLTATPASGTAPYTYAWTGPGGFNATSQSINPTVAGEYCVVVTDAKGCVSEPGCGDLIVNPNLNVSVDDDEVCAGFNGSFTANVSSGSAPYTYAWTGPGGFNSTAASITPSVAGEYCVTVTDVNGCTGNACADLIINPNPTVQVNDDEVCAGFEATLTATPAGGTAPYTYAWTGPGGFNATSQSINPTVAGEYCVVVTDAKGCVSEPGCGDLIINANPTVQVNDDEICAGFESSLTATPAGGTAPYTYAWTGPGGFNATSQTIHPTVAGEYCVVVTDSKGCVSEPGCGDLTVNPNLSVSVDDDTVCDGENGSFTANVSNGTGPYTYAWTGPGGFSATTATITPSVDGEYCVVVTDSKGCEGSACADLTVNPNPTCEVTGPTSVLAGQTGLIYCVDVLPAGGSVTYQWSIVGDASIIGSSTGACIEVNVGAVGTFCVEVDIVRDGCPTECELPVSVGGELFCSYTQGFYGNYGGYKCFEGEQTSTIDIIDAVITPGNPLVIGKVGTRSLTIEDGNEECIVTRLPGGGPADVLPDFGDEVLAGDCTTSPAIALSSKGNWRNILLAQTVALAINVRVDGNLGFAPVCKTLTTQAALPGPDGCLGTSDDVLDPGPDPADPSDDPIETWTFSDDVLWALDNLGLDKNVYGILELANRALAGMNVGPVSLSDIAGAAANINEGFDECRFLVSCEDPELLTGVRTELVDFDQQDRDVNVANVTPVAFALAPNFPNPFQRATSIRFALPEASEVTITVHDVRGRQIAVLVDEYMEAGERSVGFDAADNGNLASGVYFYRMQARGQSGETFTKTMKMLLTR